MTKINKFINCFTILLLIGILICNIVYFPFSHSLIFFISFLIFLFYLGNYYLYKKEKITSKCFYLILAIFFCLAIFLRLYFINHLTFNLSSDFALAFNTATSIANNTPIADAHYLSYNGYFYIFSNYLALIFKIFGSSIKVIMYSNLVHQLISIFILYKILCLKSTKATSLFLSILYFLMPSYIFTNLLVTTENVFMPFFFLIIYLTLKNIHNKTFSFKNYLFYLLLGILFCFTNYIRPAVSIFLIATVIYFILNMKHLKEIIFIVILIVSMSLSSQIMNIYIEHGLGEKTNEGALGWAVYYGTNYNHNGAWNLDDSEVINSVLATDKDQNKQLIVKSIKRLENLGFIKTVRLAMVKYKNLWKDSFSTYPFVKLVVNEEKSTLNIDSFERPWQSISTMIVIVLCLLSIVSLIKLPLQLNDSKLILALFTIFYILSNLLVCINGRYNLPIYPMLIFFSANFFELLLKNNTKLT